MSVKTSTFGSVRLSGADAKKFKDQVKSGRPTKESVDAYKRGTTVAKEYQEKGYATLQMRAR